MDNKIIKPHLSGWFWADLAAAASVVIIGSWIVMMYPCLEILYFLCFLLLVIIPVGKKHYRREEETDVKPRIPHIILRTVFYAAVVLFFSVPSLMRADCEILYPIQRSIFLSRYANVSVFHELLPEKLPEDISGYSCRFQPSVLQGKGYVQISFTADKGYAEKMSEKAKSMGAEPVNFSPEDEAGKNNAATWMGVFAQNGASPKDPEVWIFGENKDCPCAWLLDRERGYTYIYW